MVFIDCFLDRYGVESICRQLLIAPSTYYEHKLRQSDPTKYPDQVKRDHWLRTEIKRVWDNNLQVYVARKVWHQLKREGIDVARCTVELLMKELGIRGVMRGVKCWTTVSDDGLSCPA